MFAPDTQAPEVGLLLKRFPSLKALLSTTIIIKSYAAIFPIAWPGAKVTPVGEPCYG
jgi:hypothetical protein